MPLAALAQTILTFVAIVGIGALLRATGVVSAADARPLNAVIIYVGLPAFIFRAVHGVRLTPEMWVGVGVAWVVMGVLFALAWLLGRALKLDRPRAGAVMLAAALGNTGYIGYPLTSALFGASSVPKAVLYDVFGTVVALVVVGMPIAARFGRHDEGPVNPLLELIRFPAVIALAVALVTRGVSIPLPVSDGLDLLAKMVAPLIMLSVGISLRPSAVGSGVRALAGVSALRLVVGPLVALGCVALLGMEGRQASVTVLEAGVPSMMLTVAVGQRFGLDDDFLAAAVFVTTALSAVTIPLLQMVSG